MESSAKISPIAMEQLLSRKSASTVAFDSSRLRSAGASCSGDLLTLEAAWHLHPFRKVR